MKIILFLLVIIKAITSLSTHGHRANTVNDAKRFYKDSMGEIRRKMKRSNNLNVGSYVRSTSNPYVGSVGEVNPTDFGADPTGRTDSTMAFQKAIDVLFNVSAYADREMASGIHNLGGATLDLKGGEFLISEPIRVPPLVGNVRIRGGTLRASATFPSHSFLIEIGGNDVTCVPKDSQGVCNEFVAVEDMFLDVRSRSLLSFDS